MPLKVKRTVEPNTALFFNLDDGIQYLRIPTPVSGEERNLVALCLDAAFDVAERDTDRAIRPQTWKLYLDAFPCRSRIELPFPPLVSVASITYTKQDNTTATLSTSVYEVDNIAEPGRLALREGQAWPSDVKVGLNVVVIEFSAGYASIEEIPKPFKIGILGLASHFYDSRSPVVVGAGGLQAVDVPKSFEWIFEKWRIKDYHNYLTGR